MKKATRMLRRCLALVAIVAGVLCAQPSTAAADLVIGSGMSYQPPSTSPTVAIIDPCVTQRWYDSGGYKLWGAVRCGESADRTYIYKDYWYYDRWSGRYVGTGRCWQNAYTGILWGCVWI